MLAHKELVDMGVNATILTKNEALGFSHWQFKPELPISVFGGQQNSKLTTYPVHWKYLDRNMGVFPPIIVNILCNLWERDILEDMGVVLTTDDYVFHDDTMVYRKVGMVDCNPTHDP